MPKGEEFTDLRFLNFPKSNRDNIESLFYKFDFSFDGIIRIIVFEAYATFVERGIIFPGNQAILDELENRISKYFADECMSVKQELDSMSDEEIKSFVLSYTNRISNGTGFKNYDLVSNNLIEDIVYKLLKIEDDDTFCDFGSGYGFVLIDEYLKAKTDNKEISLSGIEMNSSYVLLSEALIAVLSDGKAICRISTGDIFNSNLDKCNKGYIYPSYDVRSQYNMIFSELFSHYRFNSHHISQWAYVDRMLSNIDFENGGRGVALLFAQSFFRAEGKEYLSRLVDAGLIEGIIKLPPILSDVSLNPFLVVFSSNNKGVTFLNANNEYFCPNLNKNFTRQHSANDFKVDELISSYFNAEADYSVYINNHDIDIEDSWDPECVISSSKNIMRKNYISLNQVAEVFAGAQYTVSSFNITNRDSGYKILTSKDIEDGMINWNGLDSIEMDKTLFDRYIVKKNDVILTSKSSKVKTVVVDIEPNEKVIVTGGMIIVRPDTDKLNPTFLKMYLDSDEGQEALKGIQTGSTIMHISPKSVETLKIPPLDLNNQNELSIKYMTKLAQLNSYKEKAVQVQSDIDTLINSAIHNSLLEMGKTFSN